MEAKVKAACQQGATLVREPGWSTCAQYCFRSMLEREQELHREFVCFYHAYNYSALLYEVQAVVARVVYGLRGDAPPLTRLFKAPFNKRPMLSMLMEEFGKATTHGRFQNDHNPEFRALAIAATVSLLGADSEAQALNCFVAGSAAATRPRTGLCSPMSSKRSASAPGRSSRGRSTRS